MRLSTLRLIGMVLIKTIFDSKLIHGVSGRNATCYLDVNFDERTGSNFTIEHPVWVEKKLFLFGIYPDCDVIVNQLRPAV